MNRFKVLKIIYMIVAVLLIALIVCIISLTAGCGNKQIFDTTYTFSKAIIELPGGEIVEGTVQSWTDYEDGDQIQVKIDGKTYLVHSSNICLMTS